MRLRPGRSSPDPEEFRPGDLGHVGAQLWDDITAGWRDFNPFQLILLRNVAQTADLINWFEALLGVEELVAPDGPRRLVIDELQKQRALLVELTDSIDLPEDGPKIVMTEAGEMARRAVRARWGTGGAK